MMSSRATYFKMFSLVLLDFCGSVFISLIFFTGMVLLDFFVIEYRKILWEA
jgi:hypothetical protein